MEISEIFYSLQGEGVEVGRPVIFIRTAGCSQGCVWCDTKITPYIEMTPKDIFREVTRISYKHGGISHIVITGGEPMEQSSSELIDLLVELHKAGKHITMETSGCIYPDLERRCVDLWSLSPKLSSAKSRVTLGEDALSGWIHQMAGKLQIKFVIATEQDFEEVKTLLYNLPDAITLQTPIILQPEGSAMIDNITKIMGFLSNMPDKSSYNIRLIPQVHKLIGVR
jgi:7-carboxy-7-deazaguanine synthase